MRHFSLFAHGSSVAIALFTVLTSVALLTTSTFGQIPPTISFQGQLKAPTGVPISGAVDIDLALYTDSLAGTMVWSETWPAVSVEAGYYELEIGGMVPLVPADFLIPLYLQITIDEEDLPERIPLTSVPYALHAARADTASFVANLCSPGDFMYCYTGPPSTLDVGECRPGRRACDSSGIAFGSCTGELQPIAEICDGLDNDCDGSVDNPPPCCQLDSEPNDTYLTADDLGSILITDPSQSLNGTISDASDEDWYLYQGGTTGGQPRGNFSVTGDSEEPDLCAYFDCWGGSEIVGCSIGTSSSVGGHAGCCSTSANQGVVSMTLTCDGYPRDDADVYMKVAGVTGQSCDHYTLSFN